MHLVKCGQNHLKYNLSTVLYVTSFQMVQSFRSLNSAIYRYLNKLRKFGFKQLYITTYTLCFLYMVFVSLVLSFFWTRIYIFGCLRNLRLIQIIF